MKKLIVLLFALFLVVAFTMPASALENVFGGYWRVRAYTQQNFAGRDEYVDGEGCQDVTQADTRTRLYYTAIVNDNLKLVNKFEIDNVFGTGPGGDIGADGVNVEVKNTYADFTIDALNVKLGIQGGVLGRGLLFDDDFSGLVLTYKAEGFTLPFIWVKAFEGGVGEDANDYDFDYYVVAPSFKAGENLNVNPYLAYVTSSDASNWANTSIYEDTKVYYVGVDIDAELEMGSAWFTGIYQGGEADLKATPDKTADISTWLVGLGADVNVGPATVHGQMVYATGDDDLADPDREDFFVAGGQSYYWAEIMGYGTFDNQASANACADQISNIWFANLGATFKPMDKMSFTADLWYARLVEAATEDGDEDLGTELDLKLTYELVEGLNIDFIGAYLFAGDGTYSGSNDANPYELGTQLSLKF